MQESSDTGERVKKDQAMRPVPEGSSILLPVYKLLQQVFFRVVFRVLQHLVEQVV